MSNYPMLKAVKLAQKDLQEMFSRVMALLETMERHLAGEAEQSAAATSSAAAAPKTNAAKLVSMTRDETKNSRSPFWRCGTSAGFMVNVFKHDDPLKDNFNLFDAAGYAPEMLAMSYGDNITWTRDAIAVELVANGAFWNVVKVENRDMGAMPDEPEPEDDQSSEDIDTDDDAPIIL